MTQGESISNRNRVLRLSASMGLLTMFLRNGAPLGESSADAGLGKNIGALFNLARDPVETSTRMSRYF